MKDIKIQVRNPAHSELIQNMLFAVGCKWRSGDATVLHSSEAYLYVEGFRISKDSGKDHYDEQTNQEVDFDWFLPLTHSISIDGKDTWLTRDKYNELRTQLGVKPIQRHPEAKIGVKNPKHSEMIQKMLFTLDYTWLYDAKSVQYETSPYLYLGPNKALAFGTSKTWFRDKRHQKIDFSWLLDTTDHKITIDSKDITLSEEFFNNIKEQLGG